MERAGMGRVRVLSLPGYFWRVATDNLYVICQRANNKLEGLFLSLSLWVFLLNLLSICSNQI